MHNFFLLLFLFCFKKTKKGKQMIKKLFTISCFFISSSFVFAENHSGSTPPFTGFFVEGGIGGYWGDVKSIGHYNQHDGTEPINFTEPNRKKSYSGVSGKIALGYGHVFSKIFYLGGQVYGKMSSKKTKKLDFMFVDINTGSAQLRETDSLGVRFHPGVILFVNSQNPTLFHLIAGWGSSRWKLKEVLFMDDSGESRCSKIREKITLGVGFLTKVYKNLSAGLEFTYTPLQKFTISKYQAVNNPWAVKEDFKKPNNKTLMGKISYTFRL
jgi:opacity protein-like surface antigen